MPKSDNTNPNVSNLGWVRSEVDSVPTALLRFAFRSDPSALHRPSLVLLQPPKYFYCYTAAPIYVKITSWRLTGSGGPRDLYSAPSWEAHLWSAHVRFLHCKHTIPHTCLHLTIVYQTAPLIAAIWLQLTSHLSIQRGLKAELAYS